jgi:L-lysine epsilon oxidase C-terminal domain/L-Lysine epsilon oxidase N-terminal
MPKVYKYRVHPSVGVARLGPSSETFDGPEAPNEDFVPPLMPLLFGSRYRDAAGSIRRQVAVFRVFEYEYPNTVEAAKVAGAPSRIREITMNEAKIKWTVEVANLKSLDDAGVKAPIKAPAKSLSTKNAALADLKGDYNKGTPPLVPVLLAQIGTDAAGRLRVLAGKGDSKSPSGKPMPNYDVNPGWHDDICDGPVKATVDFTGMPGAPAGVTGVQPAQSAWVVTAAPDFAHALEPVISLYDIAYSIAVTKFSFPSRSAKPSFRHDIYAILHKAMMAHWSVDRLQSLYAITDFHHFEPASFGDAAFRAHGAARLATLKDPDKTAGSAPQLKRQNVFDKLKNPVGASTGDMPLLNRTLPIVAGDVQPITPFHYKLFKQWSIGNFNDDFASPVTPPSQPELLDQAHMKSMVGGAFSPGIEVCSRARADATWSGPFRIDDSLPPGSLTEKLAIPWQADFYDCATQDNQEWWPSHRLMKVLPGAAASYTGFVDWAPYRGFQDMVDYWNELGFLRPKTVGADKLLTLSEPATPFKPP